MINLPLHFRNMSLATLATLAAATSRAELVIYPEYPTQIERDYAYAVSVTQQGGATRSIPVYNHCEKSALTRRTRGGDVNRRFCEFAFSGAPVRVDVAVCEDVQSYTVFPASRGLRHAFHDGIISIWLDRPTLFGIRLNDYDKTILSIFADPTEDPALIPQKGDPDVLYVDSWMDAPSEEGIIRVEPPVREVYIAPGAVLNARLAVATPNARIHGRGMILDPFSNIFRYDQNKNTRRIALNVGANGVVVEDIKLIDSRTFNFGSWATDVTFRNVKALSSMMCSDGFTNGGRNLLVDGAWLYIGDNGLVVSGLTDSTYRNVAIGTSCNAIFPQNSNERVTLENIDVFRADEGFVKNTYNSSLRRDSKWNELDSGLAKKEPGPQDRENLAQSFLLRNLCAIDCTHFAWFFLGGNMGTLPKTFAFENVSIPFCSGSDAWRDAGKTDGIVMKIYHEPAKWLITDNYALSIRNLFVGGERTDGFPPDKIVNGDRMTLSIANDGHPPAVPIRQNRAEINWTCPWKVFVGDALLRDWRYVNPPRGEQHFPPPFPGEELLADRAPVRSAWQRCPSWRVKVDATTKDGPSRVYRLTQCERDAGILNVITEAFLRHGNGSYHLAFDAAAKADTPVPLKAEILSNEKRIGESFTLPNDGAWHHYEADFDLDFDMSVTELAALFLSSGIPADEIRFKGFTLKKAAPPAPAAGPVATPPPARPPLRGCMLPERPTTEEDIATLASWGATMARFQIVRNFLAFDDNQDFAEYAAWIDARLDNLENVLRWADARNMKICVDLHVVPGGRRASDREMNMLHEEKWADAFVETWRHIATRLKGRPAIYGYDLVNEPREATFARNDYRELQRRAAEAIRAIDPAAPIVFESNLHSSASGYTWLQPLEMNNVTYSVHFYTPTFFCFQGVGARPMEDGGKPIVWPDPARGWDKEFLRGVLKPVRDFQLKHGVRIYVGEFSAAAWAPGAETWLRDCIDLFEEYGWDWTYHAFREWDGWSVEHDGWDSEHMAPSDDNPRKRVLLEGFRR